MDREITIRLHVQPILGDVTNNNPLNQFLGFDYCLGKKGFFDQHGQYYKGQYEIISVQ